MQSVLNLQATTSKYRNVPVLICCLSVSGGLFDRAHPSVDVQSIFLEAGDRNTTHLHEYVSNKHVDEKQIDVDGSVRSETVKIFDDVVLDGALLRKPFTIGFGIIAKLEQGAHLYFDQTRLPDGVWLLHDSGLHAIVPPCVQVAEDSTGN